MKCKPTRLATTAGFTLVEIAIVLALIGTLTTIAVPNFLVMMSRSRQLEAKTALASIFAHQRNWRSEFGTYTICLWQAGYRPLETAKRYYATGLWKAASWGANAQLDLSNGVPHTNCFFPGMAWGGYARNNSTFMQNTWAHPQLEHGEGSISYGSPAIDENGFEMIAFGSVTSSAPVWDIWSINEKKELKHVQVGL